MAKVGFISLGCAKNQVDCEQMMYLAREAGFEVLPGGEGADVAVINTCGFIDSAKSEAIDNILATAQLKEAGLVGKILVTGCLSQRYKNQIREEMPEVDGVLGTGSYGEIVMALNELLEGQTVSRFGGLNAPQMEVGRVLTTPEHYSYIKIAEGCDNRCAYCVIPSLRGRYRSRPMDDVLYEARILAQNGTKELIVVAQDTSRYGTDLNDGRSLLPELLRELCRIDGLHWIRIHYLYPDEITDELTYPSFATRTTKEGETYSSIMNDIDTMIQETVPKFIRGDMAMSEWDSFLASIEQMNIGEARDIQQAAYDRYMSR